MVRALNHLPENEKPQLILLFTNKAPIQDIRAINYPFVDYINVDTYPGTPQLPLVKRGVNKVYRKFFGKNFFKDSPLLVKADTLLDHYFTDWFPINYKKRYCWICDFQHRHLPDNFPNSTYKWCEDTIDAIIKNRQPVLLSSQDSKEDFEKFYYYHQNEVKVLRFASVLPEGLSDFELKSVYSSKTYFIVSNQFWPHKNHLTVIKAVAELKKKNIEVLVLFTGHLSDRDPAYADRVKKIITTNNLEDNIRFLGFLDRMEQLALIKNSIALIQPSLFEGWSTIVEDCKSLDKFILLSDLRVHREQINSNCCFFSPLEHVDLTDKMIEVLDNGTVGNREDNYKGRILAFARDIVDVFELENKS
jgi:glycosyltransferase involved in cell wall biosynthesis